MVEKWHFNRQTCILMLFGHINVYRYYLQNNIQFIIIKLHFYLEVVKKHYFHKV